ncbi:outer membrane beta-barrel protein [bacterium]|nr:outer membrane beta-barrel protein [bacterium]
MRCLKYLIVTGIVLAAGSVLAQNMKSLEFQVGNLNPNGTPAGVIWDLKYGIAVDEAVDISLGAAFFNKSYTKVTAVAEQSTASGVEPTTKQAELEYNTKLFPISAQATVHLPLSHPFGIYFGAGLSWQFLLNKENNFVDGIEETRKYNGGGWIARVGAEMKLGTRSSLMGEVHYNHCTVKGDEDKKQGLPVWDEVDVTGLGFKVGLRVEFY